MMPDEQPQADIHSDPPSESGRPQAVVAPRRGGLRRLTQFSIRTMLLVTAALAAVLGFWSHDARGQKAAVAWIEAHGGEVIYRHQVSFCDMRLTDCATRRTYAFSLVEPAGWRAWLARHVDIDWVDSVAAVK